MSLQPVRGLEYTAWMAKADGDRDLARQEYTANNHPDIACYLVQQSMEKYIKAQLVSFDVEPPRTHRIESLLDDLLRVTGIAIDLSVLTPATTLSSFEASSRYPGEEFNAGDLQKAIDAFNSVASFLKSNGFDIPAWSEPTRYFSTSKTIQKDCESL